MGRRGFFTLILGAALPQAPALATVSSPALPGLPFSPLSTSPERKKKLLSLAPKIDQLFRARLAELGPTAEAVGIVLDGEVVFTRGFGVRDLESKAPVDADTLFRIGSVSKTITALAVMRLRDQGKLALDAPAASYLPALRASAAPTKDSPPLTVRHLLSMTSGLPFDDLWGAVTFGYSDAEFSRFLQHGLSFAGPPGERYRYSNLGFALLGKIVEQVSGKPFSDYIASEVFAPLGMKSSGYVTGKLPLNGLAIGYFRDAERFIQEPVVSDGVFSPAGGVYTSVNDLARYAAFQLAAYPARDDPETGAVRRSTLREMHTGGAWARWTDDTPVLKRDADGASALSAISYGLGWVINHTCSFETMIQHGGFEPGYFTTIRLLPRHGLAVVMMSTTENAVQLQTFELLASLLREGGVLDTPAPPTSPVFASARDTVIRLLGGWDAELVARTFDPLTLRYSFFRNLRPDIERLGREHGSCRADGDVQPLSRTHMRFRLVCERGALDFVAYLTPGTPATIQMIEWDQELPVTQRDLAVAGKLVAAIRGEPSFPPDLLAPGAKQSALESRLSRAFGAYGRCEIDQPLWNNGQGEAAFRLRCAQAMPELSFRLEPKTARILDFTVAPARQFGAVCTE
jgi:CubicO group peptidase (beta-lactamase class C family)